MMVEYECHHEELLQNHSLKLKELENRANFKEQRIDDLQNDLKDMDKKLDEINKNVVDLMLKSVNDDKDIDKRVTSLEQTVNVLKWITTLLFGSGVIWIIFTMLR